MSTRKSDVLNKTWTINDDNEDETSDDNVFNDDNLVDDNNNSKCKNNVNKTITKNNNKNVKSIVNLTQTLANENNNINETYNEDDIFVCQNDDLNLDITNFVKVLNIDNNYLKNGIKAIDEFLMKSLNYDLVENEIFLEAELMSDNDDQLNSITFDTFKNDLKIRNNTRKSEANRILNRTREKNECLDDVPLRSASELDLKNIDSALSSTSSSSSTANLLEVKTSSPLKKGSFFSSTDSDNAFKDSATPAAVHNNEEYEKMEIEFDDEIEHPALNTTYTSFNTNEEQIEKDFINQNYINCKSPLKPVAVNSNKVSINLNRTFNLDDKKNSSSNSLNEFDPDDAAADVVCKTAQKQNELNGNNNANQTITVEKIKDIIVVKNNVVSESVKKLEEKPLLKEKSTTPINSVSATVTASNAIKQVKSGIPRMSGIPRVISGNSLAITTPLQSTTASSSSTSSSASSIATSSSSSITTLSLNSQSGAVNGTSPKTVSSHPKISEVKNVSKQPLNKKTSPGKIQPATTNSTIKVPSNNVLASKENKLNSESTSLTKRPPLNGIINKNDAKTSPIGNKNTNLTKPSSVQNSEAKKIAKTTSSMIPSIKSASSTITSIARPTVAAYKK